jgi:pimeloyl-ACP methyl ester carboxylesterase
LNLFHHDFGICDRYAGGLDAAAKVRCPASVVLGARDQMTNPKQTATIVSALNAQVQTQVQTVDAGHMMMSEAPDAVLAALRSALG